MRQLPWVILAIAWALWFGGTIALFVFVQTMFRTQRDVAVQAAPILFNVFDRYQLILAVVAMLAAIRLRIGIRRSPVVSTLCLLLILAVCTSAASAAIITPQLENLRAKQMTQSEKFKTLHGVSMLVYVTQAALLLGAGVVLPAAIRRAEILSGARVEQRQ